MKRVFAIAAVTVWVFALVLLRSAVKDFLWTPPWWHSFLVAVPAIALPILASFELRHSGEANTLRAEANRLRAEANALEDQLGTLSLTSAVESQFSAFWADKFSRFNKSLLEVLNSDE